MDIPKFDARQYFITSYKRTLCQILAAAPSSCLSDKEEDEIYGFGYGVFAAQIARQQQQRLLGHTPTSHQPLLLHQQHNYQTDKLMKLGK
ncbi:hypothetical protein NQ318_007883 [Aromia moschata]|uniref:Uncharacterized protein n=1 Tax=Aromia moschata TaxID=1265417 RepID=A0AAV8XPE2_9CUCU|nr:hypothetical protein NQ318_007883 [Aromia moschata]